MLSYKAGGTRSAIKPLRTRVMNMIGKARIEA